MLLLKSTHPNLWIIKGQLIVFNIRKKTIRTVKADFRSIQMADIDQDAWEVWDIYTLGYVSCMRVVEGCAQL